MDSTPPPKKPRRPPPVFDPGPAPNAAANIALAKAPPTPDANEPVKVKPYTGSCPHCEWSSMFLLVRFHESDVHDNPTADAIMPTRMDAMMFPGLSFIVIMVSWIGNLTRDKGRVARGRAKVRRARAEVLPRCPQAVICPNCYEVLERM